MILRENMIIPVKNSTKYSTFAKKKQYSAIKTQYWLFTGSIRLASDPSGGLLIHIVIRVIDQPRHWGQCWSRHYVSDAFLELSCVR